MTRNLNAKWSDFPAALTVGAQVLLIDADPLGAGARARSSGRSRRHQLGGQRAGVDRGGRAVRRSGLLELIPLVRALTARAARRRLALLDGFAQRI